MGTLYIVSTPIGNLEDITLRAIKTLSSVDMVLCEDTRRTGLLLTHFHIKTKLLSYYEEIEQTRLPEVIAMLQNGKSLALVSDAGTPVISDPGFSLVRECIKRDIHVVSIPGPSAFLTALTSSGLPADKFLFFGYPPEKQTARMKLLKKIPLGITTIFYCAPHKLTQTLEDLKTVFGDIDIVVGRELTKVHEELWRGVVSAAISHFSHPKGEFVLLFNIPQA